MKTTVLEVIDAEGYLSVIGKRGESTDKGTNQSRAKTRKVTESAGERFAESGTVPTRFDSGGQVVSMTIR
jgi:hypothetical protein